jgi:hypothetical protein
LNTTYPANIKPIAKYIIFIFESKGTPSGFVPLPSPGPGGPCANATDDTIVVSATNKLLLKMDAEAFFKFFILVVI